MTSKTSSTFHGDLLVDEAERAAVEDLKSRYFFSVDNKRWDELRDLFTDDARFEGLPFGQEGPDSFVAAVREFLTGAVTVHHGFMPRFYKRSAERIRARWSMIDYLRWPYGSRSRPGLAETSGMTGYGYYDEEYRREGGTWKIEFMRVARLRVDLVRDSDAAGAGGHSAPDPNWLP